MAHLKKNKIVLQKQKYPNKAVLYTPTKLYYILKQNYIAYANKNYTLYPSKTLLKTQTKLYYKLIQNSITYANKTVLQAHTKLY